MEKNDRLELGPDYQLGRAKELGKLADDYSRVEPSVSEEKQPSYLRDYFRINTSDLGKAFNDNTMAQISVDLSKQNGVLSSRELDTICLGCISLVARYRHLLSSKDTEEVPTQHNQLQVA